MKVGLPEFSLRSQPFRCQRPLPLKLNLDFTQPVERPSRVLAWSIQFLRHGIQKADGGLLRQKIRKESLIHGAGLYFLL